MLKREFSHSLFSRKWAIIASIVSISTYNVYKVIALNKHFLGILLALATGISWGIVSPIGRTLALQGVNMTTVILLRTFLVVIGCGLFMVLRTPQHFRVTLQNQCTLFIYGLLSVVCTYTGFLYSLKYLTVSAALIIHYTFPLVTLMGGIIITKERPTLAQVLSSFLILLGVWVGMFSGKDATQALPLAGILWGLVAVAGMAGQSLLGREIARENIISRESLIFYSHVWGGLCMIAIKHFSHGWADVPLLTLKSWGAIALLSCVGSLVAYAAYYTALRYISATAASLVCTVEIVTGITLAAFMSKELPTAYELAGSTIIVLAIVLAALPPDLFQRRFKRTPRQNNV